MILSHFINEIVQGWDIFLDSLSFSDGFNQSLSL